MTSNNLIKLEHICRTCLINEGNFYSLFEDTSNAVLLRNIVSDVTGLQIESHDHLPSVVCEYCKEAATNAYDFKQKSIKSDKVLKGFILAPTPEVLNSLNEDTAGGPHEFQQKSLGSDEKLNSISHKTAEVKTSYNEVKTETREVNKLNSEELDTAELHDGFDLDMDNLSEYFQDDVTIKSFKSKDSLTCQICGKKYKSKKAFYNHAKVCVKDENVGCYFDISESDGRISEHMAEGIWDNTHRTDVNKKRTTNSKKSKKKKTETMNCLFCEEIFTKNNDLIDHLKEHKDVVIYCCGMCSKTYLEKSQTHTHTCGTVNMETKDKQIEPSLSSCFTEISVQQLIESFSESDKDVILHSCTVCSMVLKSIDELLEHIETEHPKKSLRCMHCLKSFSYAKAASRHREVCAKMSHKLRCNICHAGFQYDISLNRHILAHHQGEGVSVSTRRPHNRTDLVEHIESNIFSDSLYECVVCHKNFTRKDNLKSHMRVHLPKSERARPPSAGLCLYCGRSFTSSSNLIVHMRRHTGEKPYKCEFCGKGFPRSSDLQCHRRTHTGEKPCICKVCGKAFSRSNKLTRHMRTHTGVKPYKCTYCDKAFAQSNDLTLHTRRHTGDKPYICEFCGDRFIQGTALQNHRRAQGHFPPSISESRPLPRPNELIKVFSHGGDQD